MSSFLTEMCHSDDVTMSAMASQITSSTIVYSTVYSRRRSKTTSKLYVTGLCEGNSPVTGELPAQSPVTRRMFPCDDVIMVMLYMIGWTIMEPVICPLKTGSCHDAKTAVTGSTNGCRYDISPISVSLDNFCSSCNNDIYIFICIFCQLLCINCLENVDVEKA